MTDVKRSWPARCQADRPDQAACTTTAGTRIESRGGFVDGLCSQIDTAAGNLPRSERLSGPFASVAIPAQHLAVLLDGFAAFNPRRDVVAIHAAKIERFAAFGALAVLLLVDALF